MNGHVYNEVLHQLHQNNLALQDVVQNLVKEQNAMRNMMTKVQLDVSTYKESLDDRIDDMIHNIETDIKNVYNDTRRDYEVLHTSVISYKKNCMESKNYNYLKDGLEKLNRIVESKESSETPEHFVKDIKGVDIHENMKGLKKDVELRLERNTVEISKIKESVEKNCIKKLEEYIGTEVLEEIISTVNVKLGSVKTYLHTELEQNKIRLEDLTMVMTNLKNKIYDLENPKRFFNESEINTYSIDETKTPIRHLRMAANLETPLYEMHYRSLDTTSTPKSLDITVKPLEYSNNEETKVYIGDQSEDNYEEACKNTSNDDKRESTTDESKTKIATDFADTKVLLEVLNNDLEKYQSKLDFLHQILDKKAMHSEKLYEYKFSFQSCSSKNSHSIRPQETGIRSWISNLVINLSGMCKSR